MDFTTALAFETATLDFLNENVPAGSDVSVTSVTITKQTLRSVGDRLLRQRHLQEASQLDVDMDVEGTQGAGDVDFESLIEDVFANNSQAYLLKLGGASSFFRAEFANAALNEKGESTTSSTETQAAAAGNDSNTGIIIGSVIGGLAAMVIVALLVVRYQKSKNEGDVVETRRIDLLSWDTGSQTSFDPRGKDSKGFVPTEVPSDPRGMELNGFLSSNVNFPADVNSPTDSDVYRDDENFPSSMHAPLSPIEEDMQAKLEDCDMYTPKNEYTLSQATPRGTNFVQMNFKRSTSNKNETKSKTGKILGDLENMEGEWEGQLESKVDAVAETPRQNNLEKFKVGSRVHHDSNVG